jgi:hypothetical protein
MPAYFASARLYQTRAPLVPSNQLRLRASDIRTKRSWFGCVREMARFLRVLARSRAMTFRFRKSLRIAPGVRFNFGKRGTSLSVGGRGGRATVGKTGT